LQNIPRYERSDAEPAGGEATAFSRDGFTVLAGCFSGGQIDSAVNEFREIVGQDPAVNRQQNLWRRSAAIRELACSAKVIGRLEQLYGRRAIPFQTLNFTHGSEQSVHCDSMHFSSLPPRFMCAVWVALEDVDADNGPLVYYPGSHRLPEYQLADAVPEMSAAAPVLEDYESYPDFLQNQIDARDFAPQELKLKKGDALIWSSNLAHGGMPIVDPARTRLSQITHYYFENCVYYTPRLSQPYIGRYWLRRIENISSGAVEPHRFSDQEFTVPAPGLYSFSPSGRPRPVGGWIKHRIAQARNLAGDLLRKNRAST